jgi:hypothetical protein
VRFSLLLLALLVAAMPLRAQQQERSLLERIEKPDENLTFDVSRASSFTGRSSRTSTAKTKGFFLTRMFAAKKYDAATFGGTKIARQGEMKFATRQANTKGRFAIADKVAETKTMRVKDARESGKSMPVRDLPDGKREYLGPESKKLRKAVDPETMADWRRSGGESVAHTGTTIERMSSFRELKTIDDVRELLNKNE